MMNENSPICPIAIPIRSEVLVSVPATKAPAVHDTNFPRSTMAVQITIGHKSRVKRVGSISIPMATK